MQRYEDRKSNSGLRVYQSWQGNEVFFCSGYLVAGPNWKATFGSAALIVAPTVIFLIFVAPYLSRVVHAVILVFACLLPTLSITFLVMTACRDPGIIPRQEPDEEFLAGRKPRTKEVFVNEHKVIIRYNDTCHLYQPPRAHHCSINDNCIERFDHHCPWVGTTIGKRNYRTFLLFVFTSTVLCLYVIGCGLAQLFVRHNELVDQGILSAWGPTLVDCAPALALMGYCFLFMWFVGGLSGFHCYLVATNQTTYENFRWEMRERTDRWNMYNHDERPNPYDQGIFRNCFEVLCAPIPPSKVDFRALIDSVGRRQGDGTEGLPSREQDLAHSSVVPGVQQEGGDLSPQSMSRQQIQQQYSNRYVNQSVNSAGGGVSEGRPAGGGHEGADRSWTGGMEGAGGQSPYATSSLAGGMSDTNGSAFFTPGGSAIKLPVQAESRLGFSTASPSPPQKT